MALSEFFAGLIRSFYLVWPSVLRTHNLLGVCHKTAAHKIA
jgi:hypothetical protein